jgi:hypothetical protein
MNFVDDVVVEVLSGLKDMDLLLLLLNTYTAKGRGQRRQAWSLPK